MQKDSAKRKANIEIRNSINPFSFFNSCANQKLSNLNELAIDSDGNMVFCCDLSNYVDNNSCTYPKKWIVIGNLSKNGLEDLIKIYKERVRAIKYITCLTNKKKDNSISKCEVCLNSFHKLDSYYKNIEIKRICKLCIYRLRRKCDILN
jgi:hypothetical protein